MGWKRLFRSSDDSNKATTPTPIDRATQYMMNIIQVGEYSHYLDGCFRQLDSSPTLMPPLPGEAPEHLKQRKLGAIALAINALHEQHGTKILLADEDVYQSFLLISNELKKMEKDSRAPRWGAMLTHIGLSDEKSTERPDKRR